MNRGPKGQIIVTLEADTQELIGLRAVPLASASLNPELKAYGRVLDPSPLAALVLELNSALAASAASSAELKRLQTLAAQNNASERALQAAQSAAALDETKIEAARLRLLADWGKALARREDLNLLVQSLSSLSRVLVRLDVPSGPDPVAVPKSARVVSGVDVSGSIAATFVDFAPAVDPVLQSRGYLFLVESNLSGLAPGASVTGFIELPGEPKQGVVVPRDAVVRHNGSAWVYVRVEETKFERRTVDLGPVLGEGWFVTGGVKSGEAVVTAAAQQLLSEELKSQAAEE